jgi:hypothetical protein
MAETQALRIGRLARQDISRVRSVFATMVLLSSRRWNAVTNQSSNIYRFVSAPEPSRPELHNTVLNVNCVEGEDVEWQWTETPKGRYVSGYRIVRIDSDLTT